MGSTSNWTAKRRPQVLYCSAHDLFYRDYRRHRRTPRLTRHPESSWRVVGVVGEKSLPRL